MSANQPTAPVTTPSTLAPAALPTTGEYHSALVRALLVQIGCVVFTMLILDGGVVRRQFCALSILYWFGAVTVLVRRPGAWGIAYLRKGLWYLLLFVFLFGMIVPRDWQLDWDELLPNRELPVRRPRR